MVEIYNEKNTGAKNNILSLSLYFSMFFKFIAGPVAKYKDIKSQIQERTHSAEIFANGIHCFVCGLCKKLIFANTLKEFFSYTKALPSDDITTLGAWLGIFAFGLSIYYELSGYFDMALGVGKMFGFELPKNFDYPYKAKSITEFWQSWNISLYEWFLEYLPTKNIFLICLFSGFWYGSKINYIIWGLYFGAILLLEKKFLFNVLNKAPKFIGHIYAIFVLLFGWLIFAFEDMSKGLAYFGKLFGFGVNANIDNGAIYDLLHYLPIFALAAIGSTPLPKKLFDKIYGKFQIVAIFASAALFLICAAFLLDF
ncbi:MAG: hypothetical protein FWH48_07595 [Oscillospiraceae bacterium]|nr:hypothetical protein [Oscillospiraceae bacterium]